MYLRPWVLHSEDASPHVPLLSDLDILVTDACTALKSVTDATTEPVRKRRLRSKQSAVGTAYHAPRYVYKDSNGQFLRRSWDDAWKNYRCKHVVSEWAARIIQHFNAAHLAHSLEANEDDDAAGTNRKDRSPIDTSWMSLRAVHNILEGTASSERRHIGGEASNISAHAHLVEAAKTVTESLWRLPKKSKSATEKMHKPPSIPFAEEQKAATPEKAAVDREKPVYGQGALLCYKKCKKHSADAWLRALTDSNQVKKPSAEQLACIEAIIRRCLREGEEADKNLEFRSEPLRMILHGVPGAGKTQTLLWIRQFFEEVLSWQHGVEFVFCASQNTMCALIGGVTLHSYHSISHKQKDGTAVVARKNDTKDISTLFVKYQALRFLFIDEISTAGIEVLAEINHSTCTYIRKRNTWAARTAEEGVLFCRLPPTWLCRPWGPPCCTSPFSFGHPDPEHKLLLHNARFVDAGLDVYPGHDVSELRCMLSIMCPIVIPKRGELLDRAEAS